MFLLLRGRNLRGVQADTVAASLAVENKLPQAIRWQSWAAKHVLPWEEDALEERLALYQRGTAFLEAREEGIKKIDPRGSFTVVGNAKHGPATCLWPNGKEQARGAYHRNKRFGFWRFFSPEGKLVCEGWYFNDFRVGPWRFHDPQGRLFAAGSLAPMPPSSSRRCGVWQFYDAQGAVKAEGAYAVGRPVGPWRLASGVGQYARLELPLNPPPPANVPDHKHTELQARLEGVAASPLPPNPTVTLETELPSESSRPKPPPTPPETDDF